MTTSALDSLVVRRTPRICLRHAHMADAPDEYRWRRDPELARLHGRDPLDEPYHRFLQAFDAELRYRAPSAALFAIDLPDGRHIGTIGYYGASAARQSAEMGITIGDAVDRGHGHGLHAVVAFLRHMWASAPFRTIELHTRVENTPAAACFQRAGFTDSRLADIHGMTLRRMGVAREWWLLWEAQGRFSAIPDLPITLNEP